MTINIANLDQNEYCPESKANKFMLCSETCQKEVGMCISPSQKWLQSLSIIV